MKPTISNAAALTFVMALRHLDARLAPKHPLGFQSCESFDAIKVPTKAEYERMKFEHDARENLAFRDNERQLIKDMKDQIDASNKLRWN